MNLNISLNIFFALCILYLLPLGRATECYTSNKQTKKRNDDGVLYECRMEAGASILRKCVKFTREDRPGKVFRECDHVYEKIFGDAFDTTEDGCKEYEVPNIIGSYAKADEDKVKDSTVKGIMCVCSGDGCNAGDVSLDAMSASVSASASSSSSSSSSPSSSSSSSSSSSK